jgi:hypothetical protein
MIISAMGGRISQVVIPDKSRTTIKLPDSCSVKACEDMSQEVESLFGYPGTTFA